MSVTKSDSKKLDEVLKTLLQLNKPTEVSKNSLKILIHN